MSNKIERIYNLWPTLTEMAHYLGESRRVLVEARRNCELPNPRHDPAIFTEILNSGVNISMRDIAQIREDGSLKVVLDRRRELIGELIEASGGGPLTARRLKITANYLRVIKNSGRLPGKYSEHFKALAVLAGVELPDFIFNQISSSDFKSG